MMQRLTAFEYIKRIGLAGLLLSLPSVAGAHALLVKSEPASHERQQQSPGRVVAWYSQELESRMSSMRVFDAEGRQVDNGDGRVDLNDPEHASMIVTLPAELPAGTYTVRWNVVSATDDDPTEGEFLITVGDGAGAADQSLPPARGAMWQVGGAVSLAVFGTVVGFAWRQRRHKRGNKQ